MGSPQKVFHAPNPSTMEKWEAMSDAKDWYVILHNAVGSVSYSRVYQIDDHGMPKKRHETLSGEPLHMGSCVPAKAFGVGVDIQRLVDLGAIRQATPWEEDQILADFAKNAGRTEAGAQNATPADPPAAPAGGEDGDDEKEKAKAEAEAKAKADEEAARKGELKSGFGGPPSRGGR